MSIEDILQDALVYSVDGCVVEKWLKIKTEKINTLFEEAKKRPGLDKAKLFKDLNTAEELPFKITAFRSHMNGYCKCQK